MSVQEYTDLLMAIMLTVIVVASIGFLVYCFYQLIKLEKDERKEEK